MEWSIWKGKRIFVRLKTGDCYTGYVLDVDEKIELITILDKFNKEVIFSISDISKLTEENNG